VEFAITITLDIRPEVQAELARQAAAQGRAIEAVAAALLEDAVRMPSSADEAESSCAADAENLFELFAPVRGLLTDEEIDTLFARNRSMSRPVDLS
jgi:hypothetical protein